MKKRDAILFFAALFLFIGSSSGLQAAVEIQAVPVAGGLYLMEGLDGGNVAFLVTGEGVLVVDSGTNPEEGKLIMDEIAKKTDKPVKYLVLTHYHGDHTFGLQAFPAATVIIAQQNTADNIRRLNKPRIQGQMEKRMPEMIAYESKLRIRLGGEAIEVIYPGNAHTNGDSLVYFPGLKVVHMGDLFFNGSLPYIAGKVWEKIDIRRAQAAPFCAVRQ